MRAEPPTLREVSGHSALTLANGLFSAEMTTGTAGWMPNVSRTSNALRAGSGDASAPTVGATLTTPCRPTPASTAASLASRRPSSTASRSRPGRQRSAQLSGQLSQVQIALLDKLPGWTWDQDATRWQQGILTAKRYIKLHRSLDDVQQDAELDGYPLGQWLHRCREDFRAGTLPQERIATLEALRGFSWGRHREHWTVGLEALTSFAATNGHASPSQHTVIDGFRLGVWVTTKRYQYRQGTLPEQQAAALESLPGWQWSPLDAQGQRGFDALRRYSDQNGHANPPRGHTCDDYPVGDWARAQRDAHDRGRMPSTRVAQLEALTGWTWNVQ